MFNLNWSSILVITGVLAICLIIRWRIRDTPGNSYPKGQRYGKIKYYGVTVWYFFVALAFFQLFVAYPSGDPDGYGSEVNLFPVNAEAKNYRVTANLVPIANYLSLFTYRKYELTAIIWPNADDPIEVKNCEIAYRARPLCAVGENSYYVEVVR